MTDLVATLFGEGEQLTPLQMALRAVSIFILALAMIRISGRRSFGQHRPFDSCTTVLLGAVLSRAVVGAAPYWGTVCAGVAIVAMHRAIAIASIRWPRFESLVSGEKRELVRDGRRDRQAMRSAQITERDLDEAVRLKTGDERSPVDRAVLERDGVIAVVPGPQRHDRRERSLPAAGSASPRQTPTEERP
jgi:uncharacterized membrane protein YcaP (DUF421 family)